MDDVLPSGDGVERAAEAEERKRILYRALRSIPSDYRNVLYLHYLEGFAIEQVTKIMGKNVKQVYNLLTRGKVALKEWFQKEGYQYEDL